MLLRPEQPNLRMIGGFNFLGAIFGVSQAEFHVGLSAAKPHVADKNILQRHRLFRI